MPEYFLAEHLAAKMGLSKEGLASFEAKGVVRAVVKNGRTYYSSRDFYRLKGVLHFMRDKGLSLEAARARVAAAARPVSATAHQNELKERWLIASNC
jgi:DNA-binding transcriptional MerR regulator